MIVRLSQSARTLVAGAICLSILCGVLVVHAWPLWTGQPAILPVIPVDPRDLFRGESVRLDTPATRLAVRTDGQVVADTVTVMPADSWWAALPSDDADRYRSLVDRVIYVQLEAGSPGAEARPVSISVEPIDGRINLRGRVIWYERTGDLLGVDYGLDSFFMQEGTARPVEDALRERRKVQMEIAVARSGHARIRRLLVDGVATDK